jgi:hypothetical protein
MFRRSLESPVKQERDNARNTLLSARAYASNPNLWADEKDDLDFHLKFDGTTYTDSYDWAFAPTEFKFKSDEQLRSEAMAYNQWCYDVGIYT